MSLSEINHVLAPLPWQESQWQGLLDRFQAGRMPHALMLRGDRGVGKRQFAVALAQLLLCHQPVANTACGQCKGCLLNLAGSHPDLIFLEPEESGKDIRVDQVRSVVEFVGKKAQLNGYRVVVLCPAEAMNTNSSNALLKSLEEPGERTLMILVTDQVSRLLATIRSRCQVIDFTVPPRDAAIQWLGPQVGDVTKAEKLLNAASGAPCFALQLDQSEWLGERSVVARQWVSVLSGRSDPVITAGQWAQYPLTELLGWLQSWLVDVARLAGGSSDRLINRDLETDLKAAADLVSVNQIFIAYEQAQESRRLILSRANPNEDLLREELLLKWSQAARPAGR